MVGGFRDADTEALLQRRRVRRRAPSEPAALRKLEQSHLVTRMEDMRAPPDNRLEKVHGDRAGQCSVRFDDPWRVCFRFERGDALDVEIVDYH